MRYIHFDKNRCVGCWNCQLVCSGFWQRVFNPLKANLRVEQDECYGPFSMHICRQEIDAECVKACPTSALSIEQEKGFVRFDEKKCDGCRLCVTACPYDAIFIHADYPYIFKCDLCNGGKFQQCVAACPRDALQIREVSV
jgi:Fe-S-cluster-containing dehydrogenase component